MASRRRPRRGGSSSGSVGDGDNEGIAAPGQDFLDESEQAKVVEDLRRQHKEHARNYRRLFQALTALLLLALLYCALMLALPNSVQLEHHGFFRPSVGPLAFLLSYLATAVSALAGLAVIILDKRDPVVIGAGFGCASINMLAWLGVFGKNDPRPHWSFWWLPSAGLFTLLLGLYLDGEIKRMDREIGGLEKLKYNYKTI